MHTTNLKIILRGLWKQKFFTLLNIFGLASGMLCCMVILLYVGNESSYDAFHANGANLYRVAFRAYSNGELTANSAVNFAPTGPLLKQNLPDVLEYCRLYKIQDVVIEKDGALFNEETITFADPSFLKMFSFPLLTGNAQTALENPNSVLLTEELAKKYFGSANPIGKAIHLRYKNQNQLQGGDFTVTGIMKDVPTNSHLQFKALFSFNFFGQSFQNNWGKYAFHTYVSLRHNIDSRMLEAKLTPLFNKTIPYLKEAGTIRCEFFLQPLKDIYLYSNLEEEAGPTGNGRIIHLLIGIAAFILIVALVNYVNLSTARSVERAKEIGVRKALGSTRGQLISQFFQESFLLQTIAISIAILTMLLLLPFINQLTGQSLGSYLFAGNPAVTYQPWVIIVGIFVASLVFSGIYPALVISSYNPINVLKGKPVQNAGGINIRKVLVVVQFVISISLAIGSCIIYSQIRYITNADLGIDLNHILVVKAPVIASDSVYARNTTAFKNELARNSTFAGVATANVIPGKLMDTNTGGFRRVGASNSDVSRYSKGEIDYTFLDVFGLKLVAGRNFSELHSSDNQAVIINESAAKQLGFTSPEEAINQQIEGWGINTIIGVIRNYHHQSLKYDQTPVIFRLNPLGNNYFYVKLNTKGKRLADVASGVELIKRTWKQIYAQSPFSYYFLDESFNKQYEDDLRFGRLFELFTGLSIIIACMGLLGLTSLTIAQRLQEIAIRKVIGASTMSMVFLLAKDYLKLMVAAALLACPLVYFVLQQWLQNYSYRIEMSYWYFFMPSLLIIVIALAAMSSLIVKAAGTNPAKVLRSNG